MPTRKIALTGTISLALSGALMAQPPAQIPAVPDPGSVAPVPQPLPPVPLINPGVGVPGGMVPGPLGPRRPLRRRDYAWTFIDRPRPRKVGVHDIITVIVDEKSEMTQNSRFNRQRNGVLTAQLKEWLRINSDGNLDVAATNSPGINGQLRSQLQTFGQGLSQEGLKYRIAATVVDILPNGTLILEAHKSIRSESELWEYSLNGRIRSQDVSSNNTVNSENIADLVISKRLHGKLPDSTKRGIITRFYDMFLPF